MIPKAKKIVRTAYHEAGHCVLSAALCDTPRMVTIVRGRGYSGRNTICLGPHFSPETRAQVFLAGFAADHLLSSRMPNNFQFAISLTGVMERMCEGDSDIAGAVGCVRQLNPRRNRTVAELMRVYAITRDSLRSVWPAVEAMAATLLHKRTLDRDDVLEALDGHSIYMPVFAVQAAYDVASFKTMRAA